MHHLIRVTTLILAFAVSAQALTFSRVSPSSSSVTTYEDHTVTFKVHGSGLLFPNNWDEAQWYVDGWRVGTTAMSGQSDTASWSRTFGDQGDFEVKVRGKWTEFYLVGLPRTVYTDYITWHVSVNACDPTVSRVSPNSNVTVNLGSGDTFIFSASDPGGDLARAVWFVDDQQVASSNLSGGSAQGQRSQAFYSPGTHGVVVRVYDAHDLSAYTSWRVTVLTPNQAPVADAGGPYTGKEGQAISFDGSGSSDSDGTIVSYAWDFGDGSSGAGANPTHTYAAPGSYTVILTVTDNDGDSDSAITTASISQRDNEPPVADAGGPYQGVVGESVAFASWGSSDPDGTIVSYAWDFGDGASAAGSQIESHTYTTPGTYTITLTVEDDRGGSAIDVTTATIVAGSDNGTPTGSDGGTNQAGGQPINLMPNPSFETHTNGRYDPDGWGLWGSNWNAGGGNSDQEWWQGCDLARTGCWLCRLRVGSGDYALADSPLVETVPGKQYYVGAWIKDLQPGSRPKPSATAPRLKFEFYDRQWGGSRDDSQTYAVDLPIPADNEWHWADVALRPTSSHPWVKVLLLVENWASDGSESEYLYDDIWFGEGRPANGDGYIAIAAGDSHSLALSADGSIVGWGNNDFGQASPPAGHDFVAIAASPAGFHSLALRSDGSIVGWGDDQYGQAGPPAGNDFIAIAAGGRHSLALRGNGRLVAWGDNSNGQTNAPTGNDFVAVGAGRYHSIALKSDGSIVAWGRNTTGQSNSPSGNGFAAIVGGGFFSLALKTDGSLVGWGGKNTFGQASPPAGHNFVAVSAGVDYGLALKTDGSIVAWGNDGYGQASPPADTGFTAVAGGGRHSLALRVDGSVVGWGNNDYGQASSPSIGGGADVTKPGDMVQGVPYDGDWPAAETPSRAIDDDVNTKFLHFKGDFDPDAGPSGLRVAPSMGPTIVTELRLTSANDVPGRDPVAFELYGSKQGISGPYTLIAHGDIVDFGGAAEWPRFTPNQTPITFQNEAAYVSYQLLFTAIRGPAGGSVNSMQIAEVELIGVSAP